MPTFRYDSATVHYGDSGSGDPLLLLHSGGSSGAQWRKVGEHLTGRRLLTPDFYGYGGTDAWRNPGNYNTTTKRALRRYSRIPA